MRRDKYKGELKGKHCLSTDDRTDRMLPDILGRDHVVLSGKGSCTSYGTFLATELLKLRGAKDLRIM